MTQCFIALGSNLEQPLQQVQSAAVELADIPQTRVISVSPWYQSIAIGPGEQADVINGVAEISTHLPPLELLAALQEIENIHQRVRVQRWGPRTLDLDLLLYGDQTINLPTLTVPHPRMMERNFVLYPLADIAPNLILETGVCVTDYLKEISPSGLGLVDPNSYPTIATKI